MGYWLWRLAAKDELTDTRLSLNLAPTQVPGFLAERGDVLILLKGGRVVAAAELLTSPRRGREFAAGLPERLEASLVVRVSEEEGIAPSEVGMGHLVDPARGDLVGLSQKEGSRVLAALSERPRVVGDPIVLKAPTPWLPHPPPTNEDSFPPWQPETLGPAFGPADAARYAYVVVDEIVGGAVGLSVAPWPGVDKRGRLRFTGEDEHRLIGVEASAFADLLARERVVMVRTFGGQLDPDVAHELRHRELTIGDTFAVPARILGPASDGGILDVRGSEPARIYDISLEARKRAKVAMAATLAAPLDEDMARALLGDESVDEPRAEEEASRAVGAGPEGVIPAEELGPGELL